MGIRQLAILGIIAILVICILYLLVYFRKKKKRPMITAGGNVVPKNSVRNSVIVQEETEPMVKKNDSEIYLEKGDRTFWQQVTLSIEGLSPFVRDFYSYEQASRERILNEFYYVNDREVLVIDDEGEHYYNQNKIEKIDYLWRKIPADLKGNAEQEQEFEKEVKELEQEEQQSDSQEVIQEIPENLVVEFEQKKGRFSKKKKRKIESSKKLKAKTFNRVFVGGMVLFVGVGTLAFFRTLGISGRVTQVQATVQDLPKEMDNKLNGKLDSMNVYRLNSFMNSFFDSYITVSDDSDFMKKRGETVKSYLAENVSVGTEKTEETRTFLSSEIVDLTVSKKVSTAKYRVSYSVKDKVNTAYYVVNFVDNKGSYSLVSLPATTQGSDVIAEFLGISIDEDTSQELKEKELESVQKFVEVFLAKYAGGNREELTYFMTTVETMGGEFSVESVDNFRAYQHDDSVHCYVKVTFKETETGIVHQEDFSLNVTGSGDQFKVEKMNHYLGGL